MYSSFLLQDKSLPAETGTTYKTFDPPPTLTSTSPPPLLPFLGDSLQIPFFPHSHCFGAAPPPKHIFHLTMVCETWRKHKNGPYGFANNWLNLESSKQTVIVGNVRWLSCKSNYTVPIYTDPNLKIPKLQQLWWSEIGQPIQTLGSCKIGGPSWNLD